MVQVGAALREYSVRGFPVIDGFAEDQIATGARGQPLIPWPNRLAGGRYEFGGQELQLPLSEPSQMNAIHGLVRWSAWEPMEASATKIRLGHVLWPQPGYPFTLALELDYELSGHGLRVTMTAENAGAGRAPFGAGQHPYVRAELGRVDSSVLLLPADSWLEMDARQIPTGRLRGVAGTEYDFRRPRPIGAAPLDAAFAGLARDTDGLARISLAAASGSCRVTMWLDSAFDYVMAYTGDTLDEAEQRRSIALEPMTCAPDAFRNGLGLVVLEPGQRVSASWGLTVS